MLVRWFVSALVFLALSIPLRAQDRSAITDAIQKSGAFQLSGSPVEQDQKSLTKVAASVASALEVYGFRGATSLSLSAADGSLQLTLFEMMDSPAAYGIYTYRRSRMGGRPTSMLVGADSFEDGNQLYFWQSKYFVEVSGPTEARNGLGREVSQSILGRSRKPPVAGYLPPANRVAGTERYILTPEAVEGNVGMAADQLGFDVSVEGAAATYKIDGVSAKLLLLLYPTQHLAKKYEDLLGAAEGASGSFRKRAGPLLAIVYGSRNADAAAAVLNDISHEFKVTWNEPPPDLQIGTLIVTVFTFIALALFFTVLTGVGFGGLRIWVKARYPNKVFDRPEAMELIQLKLFQGVTEKQIESGRGGNRS